MNAVFCLTLALSLASASTQKEWTALPLPAVAQERPASSGNVMTAEGKHIYLRSRESDAGERLGPLVPAETITHLLESRARSAGQELTLLPGMPPLLATGSNAALAAARATLAELNVAGSQLDFDLQVCLAELGENPANASLACEGARVLAQHAGTYQPGEDIQLGERMTQPFLCDYRVDVAADSGVASPVIGEIVTGQQIGLTVHRVLGASTFFVQGILDFSEIESLELFETDAPDLGVVQQPVVRAFQLAFSAITTTGIPIVIEVLNAPLATPSFQVVILLEDSVPRDAANNSTLSLQDLSFLSLESPRLPLFELSADHFFRGVASEPTFAAIPTRALTSLVSERRGSLGLYAANRAILVENTQPEIAAKLRSLISAYERGRLASGSLEVRHSALVVRAPSTTFAPTRLVAGRERTELIGYGAEIAPETWMPQPHVQRVFEGLVLDARQASEELHAAAARVRFDEPQILSRFESNLGRIQLRPRTEVRGSRTLPANSGPLLLWPESGASPELSLVFSKD